MDLHLSTSVLVYIISSLLFFILTRTLLRNSKVSNEKTNLPISYPIIGSILPILKNKHRRIQWQSEILTSTPNLTFTLHRPFGYRQIFTANAQNVKHILKSHFANYPKGQVFFNNMHEFLGNGIFNVDGENWKFQRQVSSHQFNTKSLRKFVETVVDTELTDRLIPILQTAAANKTVLDLQDILQRFAFDNICKIAFGYDPAYLSSSLPKSRFSTVFEKVLILMSERFNANIPFIWKIKKALNIGKEKEIITKANEIRTFAKKLIRDKKQELENATLDSVDLLSRFLSSGHSDDDFVTDIVISYILAGRDTTSAALTWFFYLISQNQQAETSILKEITNKNTEKPDLFDEVKNLVYTHASLSEAMRLYPPVPIGTKHAANDDVLPDGTVVKKGTRISYHPYAMGRVESVWGKDWAEFRPERWFDDDGKWVGKDQYAYPVFQAGPRVCLGKEMAFLQMKRIVAGVLKKFRVVPAVEDFVPVYVCDMTTKMKGGFLVKIQEREG